MAISFLIAEKPPPGAAPPTRANGKNKSTDGCSENFKEVLERKKDKKEEELASSLAGTAQVVNGMPEQKETQQRCDETETSRQSQEGEHGSKLTGIRSPGDTTGKSSDVSTRINGKEIALKTDGSDMAGVKDAGVNRASEDIQFSEALQNASVDQTLSQDLAAGSKAVTDELVASLSAAEEPVNQKAEGPHQQAASSQQLNDKPIDDPAQRQENLRQTQAGTADTNKSDSFTSKVASNVSVDSGEKTEVVSNGSKTEAQHAVDTDQSVNPAATRMEGPQGSVPLVKEAAGKAPAVVTQQVQEISNALGMSIQNGKSSVRMQLHPEELGMIDIRLTSTHQGLGITILTEQASTGRLLEKQIDQLRQTMNDAGINLLRVDIGAQNQQGFYPGGKDNSFLQDGLPSRKNTYLSHDRKEDSTASVQTGPSTPVKKNTLVDYRV